MHGVADCIIRRVVPQPAEWENIGNHIEAVTIFARSYFVFMRGFDHSHRRRRFFVLITRFSRTNYNLSKFTSSRFCWYLNHNNRGFLASRILKTVVRVAVLFCSRLNYATVGAYRFCSDQMASQFGTKYSIGRCPLNMSDSVIARIALESGAGRDGLSGT